MLIKTRRHHGANYSVGTSWVSYIESGFAISRTLAAPMLLRCDLLDRDGGHLPSEPLYRARKQDVSPIVRRPERRPVTPRRTRRSRYPPEEGRVFPKVRVTRSVTLKPGKHTRVSIVGLRVGVELLEPDHGPLRESERSGH